MDKSDAILIPVIESAIRESLTKFEAQKEDNTLSDLYLRFDSETAAFIIYDDMENCLLNVNLEKEQDVLSDDFDKHLVVSAKNALQNLEKEGLFDKEFIFKPFSVSLMDDDFIVLKELLFIDDDTLRLDNDLLTNLDDDLDAFLRDLMKN